MVREWHCCHQRALAGPADNNPGKESSRTLLRPSLLSNLAEKGSGNCLSKRPCHPSTDSSGPFTGAKSQNQSPLKAGGKLTRNSMGFAKGIRFIEKRENENYSYFLLLNVLVSSPCKCVIQVWARKIKA